MVPNVGPLLLRKRLALLEALEDLCRELVRGARPGFAPIGRRVAQATGTGLIRELGREPAISPA